MMNWDGLGDLDEDDDLFLDTQSLSTIGPQDLDSSSSDEEFEDSRMSFSSAADLSDFLKFQTCGRLHPNQSPTDGDGFSKTWAWGVAKIQQSSTFNTNSM